MEEKSNVRPYKIEGQNLHHAIVEITTQELGGKPFGCIIFYREYYTQGLIIKTTAYKVFLHDPQIQANQHLDSACPSRLPKVKVTHRKCKLWLKDAK